MDTAQKQELNRTLLKKIIVEYRGKPGAILSILEELQKRNKHKYLPQEILLDLASQLNIAPSRIYSVVTFYSFCRTASSQNADLKNYPSRQCHALLPMN